MIYKHFFGPLLGLTLALGCSATTTESGPCEKTKNGSSCRADGDCCSGSCRWQGGGFCQEAKLDPPPCQEAGDGCTQGSHCCSTVCESDRCVGQQPPSSSNMGTDGGGAGVCRPPGAGCATGRECCTGACADGRCGGGAAVDGGFGGGGGGGFECKKTLAICSSPNECCSRLCVDRRCK